MSHAAANRLVEVDRLKHVITNRDERLRGAHATVRQTLGNGQQFTSDLLAGDHYNLEDAPLVKELRHDLEAVRGSRDGMRRLLDSSREANAALNVTVRQIAKERDAAQRTDPHAPTATVQLHHTEVGGGKVDEYHVTPGSTLSIDIVAAEHYRALKRRAAERETIANTTIHDLRTAKAIATVTITHHNKPDQVLHLAPGDECVLDSDRTEIDALRSKLENLKANYDAMDSAQLEVRRKRINELNTIIRNARQALDRG